MEKRSKSRGGTEYTPYRSTIYKSDGSIYSQGSWSDRPTYVNYESFTGYDIKDYHKRKARGDLLPHTQFDQFSQVGSCTGSYAVTHPNNYYTEIEGEWVPTSSGDWVGTQDNAYEGIADYDGQMFVQEAAANIYSNNHDTLTFLVELKKSAALFKDAYRRLYTLLRVRNLHEMSPKDLARYWLEYRYGWRILYYDIIEIQKVLETLDDSRKRYSQKSGRTYTYTDEIVTNSNSVPHDLEFTTNVEINVSVRGAVVADITPPKFRFNPFTTGWEVVRYSFILDWMVNIGQWLEALSFHAIQTDYCASYGVKFTSHRIYQLSNVTFKNGYSGTASRYGSGTSVCTIRRPSSVSIRPHVALNLSVPKVLDLAAIGYSLITNSLKSGNLRL